MEKRSYKIVLLDVDALSCIESLESLTDDFYSIAPYIMDKAKQVKEDLRQRLLQRIHAISPTAESIFAVKNFSTEAGYSEQLTELDILFMAAAYETEKKTIGIDHINRIPLLDKSRYFESTGKLREVGVNVCAEPCVYFSLPGGCSRGNGCFYRHPGDIDNRPVYRANPSPLDESGIDLLRQPSFHPLPNGSHVDGGSGSLVVEPAVDDEYGNWVGSEELGTFDKNLPETVQPIENPIAVCTGNTVVQSILLQMGFQLISLEGNPITKLKIWTRKCSLCFRICKEDSRVYCPYCGNRSLKRVQVFINKHGVVGVGDFLPSRIHKRKNRWLVCYKHFMVH